MGRPKIKDIDTAIDLDKIKLPEQEEAEIATVAVAEVVDSAKTKTKKAKGKKDKVKFEKKPSLRYSELLKLIDKSKTYSLPDAIELLKKTANTKFDSSVEAHLNLQIDKNKQTQQIRTTTTLPTGTGKKMAVLVFGAKDTKAVKDSGATVGDEETLEKIEKGKIDFDKVVASPDWMPKLAKVAKVLGPKGLMPNPKSGTVSLEPEKVAADLSGGLVEIKTENSPIIHVAIGKVSFKNSDLEENAKSLVKAVQAAKPAEVKKELIKSVYLTTTMGPSVKVDQSSL